MQKLSVMRKPRSHFSPEFPYHVTGRVHNRNPFPLPLDEMWEIAQQRLFYLHRAFNFRILSFVLMPNHFHAILRTPDTNLSIGMGDFMRETAKEVNRRRHRLDQLWGKRFHCSILTQVPYFLNCYKYVYQNPLRAKLSKNVESYPFGTLSGLLGQQRLTIPLEEDTTLFENPEETLSWLNQPLHADHLETLRSALSTQIPRLRRNSKTGRACILSTDRC